LYEIATGASMIYEIYDCCQNSLCKNWSDKNIMNCLLTKEQFVNCKQINQYYKPVATITQQPLSGSAETASPKSAKADFS
jgi:hypothetical protein